MFSANHLLYGSQKEDFGQPSKGIRAHKKALKVSLLSGGVASDGALC